MDGVPENDKAVWNSPSLDKLVPSLGYVIDNVVWCLASVNAFKGQLTVNQFVEVLDRVQWRTNSIRDSFPAKDRIDLAM